MKPQKEKKEKKYTRAQAERALTAGVNPEQFMKHSNYHVRNKAWKLMGKPLPEDTDEASKFLASIHVKEKVVETVMDEVPVVLSE